ncbi:hypothetical protein CXB51_019563 [Gossypium anomalum]|uniref:Uncharacterized protein n=1 Tax=Gossypium anomalum TaxID=47600 RepID=A0A8J6CSU2_9ROSI|nr:hypothetical protein CXB51_019563 [Gossypium anomalum]
MHFFTMVSASPSTTTISLWFISIPISIACRHANASAAKGLGTFLFITVLDPIIFPSEFLHTNPDLEVLDRSLNAAPKLIFNIGGSGGLHRSISIHLPGNFRFTASNSPMYKCMNGVVSGADWCIPSCKALFLAAQMAQMAHTTSRRCSTEVLDTIDDIHFLYSPFDIPWTLCTANLFHIFFTVAQSLNCSYYFNF